MSQNDNDGLGYRIFNYEEGRGVLSVEYGPPGSGITTPVDLCRYVSSGEKITDEVLHRVCIQARPIQQIESLRRMQRLGEDEVAVIRAALNKERHITMIEELASPQHARMKVIDTSK